MTKAIATLNIAKYFPLADGKYHVRPGLFPLNTDFGNNRQDQHIFQIDLEFEHYRNNKLTAHKEQLSKYYCINRFPDNHKRYITRYLISTLCAEYPNQFSITKNTQGPVFKCELTKDSIVLSNNYELVKSENINYSDLLDAIMMQVQEDIAILSEQDYLTCLHLMAPNFWSASEKIGQNFKSIHRDVAGIDTITKNSKAIIQTMIHKGPYVRFAWGITTDNELNHHPQNLRPPNSMLNDGRRFDPNNPSLYLRVERQTITGLPDIKSAIFTIRSYLYRIEELDRTQIQCLINAINSMTESQLTYKGLNSSKLAIIRWLSELL